MTYSSLPNSGQSLGQTRAAIKNNFDLIKTTLDQNHVDLDLANAGKHYVVQMPVTATIPVAPLPPAGLVAGEANLYSKTSSAASQVFYSPDASGNEYQMTRAISASYASFGTNPGFSFLPGGLLIQWGTQAGSSASSIPVTFPVAFTGTAYNVQVTPIRSASSPGSDFSTCVVTATTSNTGFTIGNIGSHTVVGWNWIAIGV